jgi:hypothetical protein
LNSAISLLCAIGIGSERYDAMLLWIDELFGRVSLQDPTFPSDVTQSGEELVMGIE